jgi:L-ascorbate metabolism protein UlaG (beta-lactamase superfamily)
MKLTKYPQSCVLVETNGKKILVDPGMLGYDERFLDKWKNADIILVTHKHGDHFYPEAVKQLNAKLYSTKEVADAFPEFHFNIIKLHDKIDLGDVKIDVVKAIHGYVPFLKGDKSINENVGFIIYGDKSVYFPSDTVCFENDYKCDICFVPVCNHGLVMGPFEAALFAKETGAELVIPYHYDNPKFPADMDNVKECFKGLNYKLLDIGEEIST